MKKSDYFNIRELVCPDVYRKFGEKAWVFIDERLLDTLHVLREKVFARPMIINNWAAGGNLTQRGLRCNLCPIVREKSQAGQLYLSAHNMGKAADITVEGLSADEARRLIERCRILLPHPVRIERDVAWLHIDVYDEGHDGIRYFGA